MSNDQPPKKDVKYYWFYSYYAERAGNWENNTAKGFGRGVAVLTGSPVFDLQAVEKSQSRVEGFSQIAIISFEQVDEHFYNVFTGAF